MYCLQCGEEIGNININRICPYCGMEQYEDPQCEISIDLLQSLQPPHAPQPPKKKRTLLHHYSEEEILALGFYPKDETYKMSLISIILGKR